MLQGLGQGSSSVETSREGLPLVVHTGIKVNLGSEVPCFEICTPSLFSPSPSGVQYRAEGIAIGIADG